jgi:hypothetical protein
MGVDIWGDRKSPTFKRPLTKTDGLFISKKQDRFNGLAFLFLALFK